jgi:hypothetical protein
MEQIVNMRYLPDGIGRASLLTIAEGGIRNEAGICRAGSDDGIVKANAAYFGIRLKFAIKLGIFPFHKGKGALGTFLEKLHGTSMTPVKLKHFLPFLEGTHILAVHCEKIKYSPP